MAQHLSALLDNVVACARRVRPARRPSRGDLDAIYLTGGSSALRPFQQALRDAFPGVELVEGDLFGGVAAGLAYAGGVAPTRALGTGMKYLAAYPAALRAQVAAAVRPAMAWPATGCASATRRARRSAPTARCTTT